jgi:hypothetical protein
VSAQIRSEYKILRDEARAIELLAEETEVVAGRLEDYWNASADLINLVVEIDELGASAAATSDEARLLELRRRLRGIAARLVEMGDA